MWNYVHVVEALKKPPSIIGNINLRLGAKSRSLSHETEKYPSRTSVHDSTSVRGISIMPQ